MKEINELKKQIADYLEDEFHARYNLSEFESQSADFARKLLVAIECLEKQRSEWLCEIKEEWPDSSHGTYLMQNVYDIDEALAQITAAKPELKSGSGE